MKGHRLLICQLNSVSELFGLEDMTTHLLLDTMIFAVDTSLIPEVVHVSVIFFQRNLVDFVGENSCVLHRLWL